MSSKVIESTYILPEIQVLDYPELTLDIMREIVNDGVEKYPSIRRVALVGSFSRGEQRKTSDVDLLVDIEDSLFSEMLGTFGSFVSGVLDYQFNKRLEIVRYSLATERAVTKPESLEFWYYKEGYEQMLKEAKWLYER